MEMPPVGAAVAVPELLRRVTVNCVVLLPLTLKYPHPLLPPKFGALVIVT